jgi:hypothetical protein
MSCRSRWRRIICKSELPVTFVSGSAIMLTLLNLLSKILEEAARIGFRQAWGEPNPGISFRMKIGQLPNDLFNSDDPHVLRDFILMTVMLPGAVYSG